MTVTELRGSCVDTAPVVRVSQPFVARVDVFARMM